MPPLLLDLIYLPVLLGFVPILLFQRFVKGKKRGGWAQRFGSIPFQSSGKPVIWVHAVSLGEVNATRSLVAEITMRLHDHDVVISTTTDTGYAAACQHYSASRVFRYPLDFSFVVRRALNRVRPAAIVLMELEVWPNFIEIAASRGIPIGIANGRVTEEKSMRRFRTPIIRSLARRMFSRMAWVGAQDEAYAARFRELGVPADRVHVAGNLKYDTASVSDSVPGATDLAAAMGIRTDAPLFVAGSTGPGEEELLLTVYRDVLQSHPTTQLAIIPRKPERFDDVARLIESSGFACVRRSHSDQTRDPNQNRDPNQSRDRDQSRDPNQSRDRQGAGSVTTPGATAGQVVFLGDTMGELRKFYSLATVVFVGRSLVPMGGSDVMEVAGLGRAMCFGPFMENFADAAEKLLSATAAVQVSTSEELALTLNELHENQTRREQMGRAAQDVVRQNAGATARTVDLLVNAMRG
ncbi:MAG: 3-deoxy-D-manno-octulosonic acid transferase [Planctomycetes bacterium]|nr:3-deoxy-D-manno-octulosonic acid transferase [Planctomycetota bacterium]